MNGTLIIEGPLEALSKIAGELSERYPEGLGVVVEDGDPSWKGWTTDAARALLARLAPKQRAVLTLIVEMDGYADGATLREKFGNETGQLRGLTGPISKHVLGLIADGLLPEGTMNPTTTAYDPENRSFQRTIGIAMEAGLVPIFRRALADRR